MKFHSKKTEDYRFCASLYARCEMLNAAQKLPSALNVDPHHDLYMASRWNRYCYTCTDIYVSALLAHVDNTIHLSFHKTLGRDLAHCIVVLATTDPLKN